MSSSPPPSTKAAYAATGAAAAAGDEAGDDSDFTSTSYGSSFRRWEGADAALAPRKRLAPTARGGGGQKRPDARQRKQQQRGSSGGGGGHDTNSTWDAQRASADALVESVGPGAEAEAAAAGPGFWGRVLDETGLIPRGGGGGGGGGRGAVGELAPGDAVPSLAWPEEAPPAGAGSVPGFLDGRAHRSARLTINRLLAKATDWRTPLTIARDCGRLLDEIGAACACHRLAKLSSSAGVPLDAVRAHPGFGALQGAVEARVPTFAPRQTANVLWSLAKLGDRASPLLPALVATLPRTPWGDWREQELANALWATGALQLADWPAAWAPLVREIKARGLARFETQAISNIVWACAYLDARDEELLGAVADSTVAAIAVAARCAAEAEARGDTHASIFSNPAAARFEARDGASRTIITPQSVSNTVWALTELDFFHSTCFEAAADDFRRRPRSYKAQEMCNLLYGFAKAGFADLAALAAVDAELAGAARRAQLTGQAVANMLWSFATLKYCPERSLGALAGEVAERAGWFGEQELANSLWALARLGYESGGGGGDGDGDGDGEGAGGGDDGSPSYGGGFGERRQRRRPRLLDAASDRVVELAESFHVQGCGNLLWALAVLGGTRTPCFNVLAARMAAMVESAVASSEGGESKGAGGGNGNGNGGARGDADVIESSQINQLFQALLLTKLERDEATAAAAVAAKASVIAERRGSGASPAEVEAAAAAAAEAAVEAAAADAALPSIPDAVARHVTRRWLQNTQETVVSVFQEDVAAALRDLGVRHSVEYTTADGLFSVDIAIVSDEPAAAVAAAEASSPVAASPSASAATDPSTAASAAPGTATASAARKVAIECDGPFHFAINTHAPTGATKLRRRLLKMLGWAVLPLPFYDHYALNSGPERARYLAALLRTAGVVVAPERAPAPADAAEVDRVERAFQELQQQPRVQGSPSSPSSHPAAAATAAVGAGEGAGARPPSAELIEAAARAAARGGASPIAAPPGSLVVPRQYSEEQAAASAAEAAAAPAPGVTWASAGGTGAGAGAGGGGRGGGAPSAAAPSSSSLSAQQQQQQRRELPPAEKPKEIELTSALIEAARRAALAAQNGRGPVPRERLAGLGLVLKRDAAAAPPSRFVAGGAGSASSQSNFASLDSSPSRRLAYPGEQRKHQQQQWHQQQQGQQQQQQQQRQASFERRSEGGGGGGRGGGYRGNSGFFSNNGGFFSTSPGRGRGAGGGPREQQQPFSPGRGSGGYSGYSNRDGGGSSWSQSGGGGGGGGGSWSQRSERDFAPLGDWDSPEERRPPPSRASSPCSSPSAAPPAPAPSLPPPPSSSRDRERRGLELSRMTVPALGLLATAAGVRRRSGLRKAELVEALLDAEQGQQEG